MKKNILNFGFLVTLMIFGVIASSCAKKTAATTTATGTVSLKLKVN